MNLSLLDPFHRQIPDRIDSTLNLPRRYHPKRPRVTKSSSTANSTDTSFASHSGASNNNAKSSRGRILRTKIHKSAMNEDDLDDDHSINHATNTNNNYINSEDEMDFGEERNVWHSCYAVSFNRRGTYLAVGHASGAVGVHDFQSRTLSSIVHPPSIPNAVLLSKGQKSKQRDQNSMVSSSTQNSGNFDSQQYDQRMNEESNQSSFGNLATNVISSSMPNSSPVTSSPKTSPQKKSHPVFTNGVTSISWARRSRTCLLASYGDDHVSLVDNRHPFGPLDVTKRMIKDNAISNNNSNGLVGESSSSSSKQQKGNMPSRNSCNSSPIPTLNNNKDDITDSNLDLPSFLDSGTLDDPDKHEETIEQITKKQKVKRSNIDDVNGIELQDYGFSNANHDRDHCSYTLKRTRYISQMTILDPNDLNKSSNNKQTSSLSDSPSKVKDVSTNDASHIHVHGETYDKEDSKGNIYMMTPAEREIHSKPASERTIEESHTYSLMKTRLDSNEKKSCKKQKIRHSTLAKRYQNILIKLPKPLQSSAQIHPHGYGGLACLMDGSLILFGVSPENSFFEKRNHRSNNDGQDQTKESQAKLLYLINSSSSEHNEQKGFFVTYATFDPLGHCVYAATKCGTLLGFKLIDVLQDELFDKVLTSKKDSKGTTAVLTRPCFKIAIPGSAAVKEIVCSRNGKMILVNSRDNILRLYDTQSLWSSAASRDGSMDQQSSHQPKFHFQDVVSKCKWIGCDFSGDGEFLVGGCNNEASGDRYELYVWNTATGNLLDQLRGPKISLHSISWHPTRPFIAIGTSDGYVDVWGPRLDWTAFAPDFQALQKNVQYIEKEDEFDTVIDRDDDELVKRKELSNKTEELENVDVTTIAPIPVFDSDSECEEDVFFFDTKICPNFSGKTPKN